ANFADGAADGSRVWFSTSQPDTALGDTDDRLDVYERAADGGLRLISPPGGGAFDAFFEGASTDGSRVWFDTREPNATLGDGDVASDVYERAADGGLRLVGLPGGGAFDAFFEGATADGSRVWLVTNEPNPARGDTDSNRDVYERSADGALRLVSLPGDGAFDAQFLGASRDGSRGWFASKEPNPGLGDTDASVDAYERTGDGGLRLVSLPGPGSFDAFFGGASRDGSRVWFETAEPNPGLGDTDARTDVYERAGDGTLRLVTPPGGGAFDAFFAGASEDGSRVRFATKAPDPALGDTDNAFDVFESRWGLPANVASPALSGEGRVGTTLACAPGMWAGEEISLATSWLRDGVPVAGRSAATYALEAGDAGHGIACRVRAANVVGAAEATSNTVAISAPESLAGSAGARAGAAPRLSRRVVVRGAPVVGGRLRCDHA